MNKRSWIIVWLPNPEIKKDIDRIAKNRGYANRSEFIRNLLRDVVEKEK